MRGLSLLVTIVAALLFVPAPAGASTTAAAKVSFCWGAPPPGTGWVGLPYYDSESCARCEEAGEAGVDRGDWETYFCGFFPIGLDGIYRLYVPAAPSGTAG